MHSFVNQVIAQISICYAPNYALQYQALLALNIANFPRLLVTTMSFTQSLKENSGKCCVLKLENSFDFCHYICNFRTKTTYFKNNTFDMQLKLGIN